jgi:hypothetical protein
MTSNVFFSLIQCIIFCIVQAQRLEMFKTEVFWVLMPCSLGKAAAPAGFLFILLLDPRDGVDMFL